jgi:hypothetical protein
MDVMFRPASPPLRPSQGPARRLAARRVAAVAVTLGGLLAAVGAARDLILFDDFETGDARFWSRTVPVLPDTVCVPAAELVEPANPTVLGDGTPGSVSRADIQAALDGGGHISFDLGPLPQTIVLDGELAITREVVLDGGGLVTLSGQDSTRVLRVTPAWSPLDAYTATLQRLRIEHGRAAAAPPFEDSGGAILAPGGGAWQATSLVVVGCSFVDNHAPGEVGFAAGINVDADHALTLRNTILAGNTAGNLWNPWNIRRTVLDGAGSLQWPPTRPNGQPEPPATASVVWAEPMLLPCADNGGLTQTMAPDDGSPAIGGGVSGGAPLTDQRGRLRTPALDVGAYETP